MTEKQTALTLEQQLRFDVLRHLYKEPNNLNNMLYGIVTLSEVILSGKIPERHQIPFSDTPRKAQANTRG
jgi:hypothetical protein